MTLPHNRPIPYVVRPLVYAVKWKLMQTSLLHLQGDLPLKAWIRLFSGNLLGKRGAHSGNEDC